MAKGFYLRLATANLSRNRRMYGPYVAAVAVMSGMFFIILNLITSQSIGNLSYGETVQAMFTIGIVVMSIFTVGYMLYINSFLIKRRKKEFGLYGVLGMEKRHVARVIIWESLMLSLGSLTLGVVGGLVFGRLVFMLLMNVLDTAQGSIYHTDVRAVLITLGIFAGVFFLATLYNLRQVRLANPIDLLKGEQKGEKKVRFALPMTLVGLGMLGYAYYLAISINNSALALFSFWPAVILVIIATWLLFTGGSFFLLRALKRNKRIYYRPKNFITISGLTHRMKQNAAGLANICILSTMVIVTVSCCCALYFGQEAILSQQNPNDMMYELRFAAQQAEDETMALTESKASGMAEEMGIAIESMYAYRYHGQNFLYENGVFTFRDENGAMAYDTDARQLAFFGATTILLDDFNRVTGWQETLAEDEILLLTANEAFADLKQFPGGEDSFSVKAVYGDVPWVQNKNSTAKNTVYFVVPGQEAAKRLVHIFDPALEEIRWTNRLVINTDAGSEQGYAFSQALKAYYGALGEKAMAGPEAQGFYRTNSIYENRLDGYALYGGLLFLGVFFSILFLINTVLILYFKQVSEGFEDGERFAILQKVGLSDGEVRSTINRQMLIVFLLPLVAALVHIAAASKMITTMLGTFMLTDYALVMGCVLATSVVFTAVYLIMYKWTARVYYSLVKM